MFAVRSLLIGGAVMLTSALYPLCSWADGMPDTIQIDTLVNLYDAVEFNHAQHIELLTDCAECHHHTTGAPVTDANCARCHKNSGATKVVACKGCHQAQPFSAEALREKSKTAYHTDRLGLKGAYHLSCTGCHSKMGGPTGCQDCHTRKKEGDAFYNSGEYAPPKTQGEGEKHGH